METLDYKYLGDLVRKAQGGNNNAFAELYTATYQQQYQYSYKYLRDEHLAEDALQETFIQALKSICTLQTPDLFIAWLNRINFNVCFDMQKKRREEFIDENNVSDIADEVRMEDEVIQIDSNKYILSQIMKLPLTESQVLLQYYYQNMTYDDIARNLNMSRSTVKRYLKTGKEHLKKLLTDMV